MKRKTTQLLSLLLVSATLFTSNGLASVSATELTDTSYVEVEETTSEETTVPAVVDRIPTTVQLSTTEYNYTGKAKTPKVTVLDQNGDKISSKYYKVSYKNNTKAGTATVKVQVKKAKTKTGTITKAALTKTFKIKAAKAAKVVLPKETYTYKCTENGICPKITVYDSKGKKISSKEYTVTYKNNKKVGTAQVTVKMSKNYGKKKFTKNFTIKYDEKTNKLLPETKILYRYKNKEAVDTLYYTKQDDSMMKKILPYGDLDVCFDEIYNVIPYMNDQAFWPGNRNYGYGLTGKDLRENYHSGVNKGAKYDPKEFTGSVADLIQCVIHSPIVKVDDKTDEYDNTYYLTCEDGSEYIVSYANCVGLQYSTYSLFTVDALSLDDDEPYSSYSERFYSIGTYTALIKVDKSKTPWGKWS